MTKGKGYVNLIKFKNGHPYCEEHGAMNKVSKDGILRCNVCHVGVVLNWKIRFVG